MTPLLEEFWRLSLRHHFEARILIFPHRAQVEADFVHAYPQQRLHAIADRLGVPVLDLLPPLRDAQRVDPTHALFFDGCHHTEYGNAVIARLVHQFLNGMPAHRSPGDARAVP
jgi:lysophospholipase L1-like esterase